MPFYGIMLVRRYNLFTLFLSCPHIKFSFSSLGTGDSKPHLLGVEAALDFLHLVMIMVMVELAFLSVARAYFEHRHPLVPGFLCEHDNTAGTKCPPPPSEERIRLRQKSLF